MSFVHTTPVFSRNVSKLSNLLPTLYDTAALHFWLLSENGYKDIADATTLHLATLSTSPRLCSPRLPLLVQIQVEIIVVCVCVCLCYIFVAELDVLVLG